MPIMTMLLRALLFLFSVTSCVAVDRPMTAEDAILMREMEWAQISMEGYKRKNGKMPLRSFIAALNVHTEDWINDSFRSIPKPSSEDLELLESIGNLRGRRS